MDIRVPGSCGKEAGVQCPGVSRVWRGGRGDAGTADGGNCLAGWAPTEPVLREGLGGLEANRQTSYSFEH